MGFEPTCHIDNGFQDRRISRSATCANLPGWNWTNTLRLSDVRSNHLSYRQKIPRAGIEPASHRLKAGHFTFKLTRGTMATGLEPIPSDLKSDILPIKLRHKIKNKKKKFICMFSHRRKFTPQRCQTYFFFTLLIFPANNYVFLIQYYLIITSLLNKHLK